MTKHEKGFIFLLAVTLAIVGLVKMWAGGWHGRSSGRGTAVRSEMMKVKMINKTKAKPFFRWYDLWIGAYIDRQAGAVYLCPLPTVGLKIWRESVGVCPFCKQKLSKDAYDTGDGWYLSWVCNDYTCPFSYEDSQEIHWPFGDDESVSSDRLRELGYEIS